MELFIIHIVSTIERYFSLTFFLLKLFNTKTKPTQSILSIHCIYTQSYFVYYIEKKRNEKYTHIILLMTWCRKTMMWALRRKRINTLVGFCIFFCSFRKTCIIYKKLLTQLHSLILSIYTWTALYWWKVFGFYNK